MEREEKGREERKRRWEGREDKVVSDSVSLCGHPETLNVAINQTRWQR